MAAQQFNDTAQDNPALCRVIAQRIAEAPQQRITFAEYMDLVLYHPKQGYYATNQVNIGEQGDFFTSPHLGADFGELLAEQFVQMWEWLDRPNPFTLVEMGAGQGLLAHDILRYLHRSHFACFEAIDYLIIEKSSALRAEQQNQLQPLVSLGGCITWQGWDDIPRHSIVGCCFSNELVDAFPVHQVAIDSGQLREVYVTTSNQQDTETSLPRFVEVLGEPSTPDLAAYFGLVGVNLSSAAYPDHYRSEVNLAALHWMKTVADRLSTGYLLTIDYGYPAARYYSPARSQGTLQCYYQHSHHSDPYCNVGLQDLTAHIDFTALERQGERCGLQTVGFTQQGLFLMALGLGDRLLALSQPTPDLTLQTILHRREALHSLMSPTGLGNFGVLIQSKGVKAGRSLKGLQVPPLA
ncbi:class I SAM-dependent methyltransferase [Oculatella sp. LEGE 06141]|uniref:class I SAM-dependent methyltransferase n=1 Tax=Oculatella sp. LEGE 06141 TaxID=1828648 RepID=UPI0018806A7B|nr:class I SAM-dependent methyltransferase [Oculatella sp. LEGE 06141]MBE9182590.1 class I SAM-dependent methyltransferase [Oculatella sp. LEGE 06141]